MEKLPKKDGGFQEGPNGENVWLKEDLANEETTNGIIAENGC